ncbi:type VI secretion system baseplate subunit TssE [Xenorhabdus sp. 42]|uniref:Type VI secretion system baseplate subunit TssE n=1 Tax=Xenorhabdus szentirmaii TaxID=290112 RepID=A0AAW3Z0R4_9GAMM|nr:MULTISPECIES: type VI secretion system baseplate subunit TssE [unclassified Xenorhabdus]MBD2792642.1 type VI secretion system baseplate subunit TssE [Xenorhabdus sp. CUL]MBD2802596.1 type VI secretion system baseplate subunit TssE [Xenorhabdus sp. M]MBD2805781.1 type VI secretion system baseplate subunit TssE [Xenorhabdus sp. ZM]MBD2821331.1 type VI secretion system baseplate subunit TssE [Xenorhabdus sp. 42]MBD2826575.1 type VI secretion system baseplate subunit TssE [Xenorhabdus sp. 5]
MNRQSMNDNITLRQGGYRSRSHATRITAKDRMQPSLLDKLTDNEPDKKQETTNHYLLSHSALRRSVQRDLQWLLNSINGESEQDLSPFPDVCRSVYNFGLIPLSGKSVSEIEWEDIQHRILTAIHLFEPRIIPDGLEVNRIANTHSLILYNTLPIEIKGFLWCVPWPLEFLFYSDIDLENGYFTIKEAS